MQGRKEEMREIGNIRKGEKRKYQNHIIHPPLEDFSLINVNYSL